MSYMEKRGEYVELEETEDGRKWTRREICVPVCLHCSDLPRGVQSYKVRAHHEGERTEGQEVKGGK